MLFFDSHIHLDQYQDEEIAEFLAYKKLLGVIAVSTDLTSSQRTLSLKKKYPDRIFAACGFHPEQRAVALDPLLEWMRGHQQEIDLIGEIGWPHYSHYNEPAANEHILRTFLQLSAEWDKPVCLHAVKQDVGHVLELLDEYGIKKAHFHWLKTNHENLETMANKGYYLSFTPDIWYEKEIQQIAKWYPPHLVMVESDGPWQFEGPFLGRRTEPRWVDQVIVKLAGLLKISVEELAEILLNNTYRFLGKH